MWNSASGAILELPPDNWIAIQRRKAKKPQNPLHSVADLIHSSMYSFSFVFSFIDDIFCFSFQFALIMTNPVIISLARIEPASWSFTMKKVKIPNYQNCGLKQRFVSSELERKSITQKSCIESIVSGFDFGLNEVNFVKICRFIVT